MAGFEAEDILLGLLMLVEQVREGKHRVDNAYPRAVSREGNVKAKKIMYEVFEPCDVEWRGFPVDPEVRAPAQTRVRAVRRTEKIRSRLPEKVSKHSACICDRVLRGIAQPTDCRLFGKAARPAPRRGPVW